MRSYVDSTKSFMGEDRNKYGQYFTDSIASGVEKYKLSNNGQADYFSTCKGISDRFIERHFT